MSGGAAVIAAWAVLAGCLLALEVGARTGLHRSLPTLDEVVAAAVGAPAARVALVLGWMWLGWHLFVR
jgi:Family of unknown function (DUF6186)